MSLTIPLPKETTASTTVPHFDFQVQLDGVTYTLEFRWNTRQSGWFMSIQEEDETPIMSGIRVVVDLPLGKRSRDERMPSGALIALDTQDQHKDPDYDELGPRVVLLYFTADELPIDPEAT